MIRFLLVFSILFGIFHVVCCENHSLNHSNLHLNLRTEPETLRLPLAQTFKGHFLENPLQKKIKEKRRLLFGEDDINSGINADRGENIDFSTRIRSNFSEAENEKESDWTGSRFQFSLPVSDYSYNFQKNSNHWEKKDDIFDKKQSKWNEEKNYKDFHNHGMRHHHHHHHHHGRHGGVTHDTGMNREDRRGDSFDRRISITTIRDDEAADMKNYHNDRAGRIYSGHMGHSTMKHYNEHPSTFWNPNYFKPEKEVVINLKTECSTPREINNQLVHKFIFQPKSPLNLQSGFSGYQTPESRYISSHKMTPMYYLYT